MANEFPLKKINNPLHFTLIGAGQVMKKYWIPGHNAELIKIDHIISRKSSMEFEEHFPELSIPYSKANDTTEVVAILERLQPHNIALLVPARNRVSLIDKIFASEKLKHVTLFIEKPYGANISELQYLKELLPQYSSQLHFSGKYARGRADILYPHIPQQKLPLKIEASLIEGSGYFRYVKDRVDKFGIHPYLEDGPELDLGFHLLDIVTGICERLGDLESIQIITVKDLSEVLPDFEKDYGVYAELECVFENGKTIPVVIQAGKRDGADNRSIVLFYDEQTIIQEYTTGTADDPVFIARSGEKEEVARHDPGYNYYMRELQKDMFAKATIQHKNISLLITNVCLDIKQRRVQLEK